MFIKKLLLLLPIPRTGVEASFSCVITYEALQPVITFALPLTLQIGGRGGRWRTYFKVNWQTKGSCILLIYLEIFFKLMYSFSPEEKSKPQTRCISFKMASLNVICGFFFTRTVLNCLGFKSYYVFLCYYFFITAFIILYSISCLFPRECPELVVSNCYLCEDCNFELVNT